MFVCHYCGQQVKGDPVCPRCGRLHVRHVPCQPKERPERFDDRAVERIVDDVQRMVAAELLNQMC